MIKDKKKIVVILGQTATGKSDFAVEVAKIIDGEIISADSRQVYRGMDLGTGKITKKEMKGVTHHLLDVADPRKTFSVAEYITLASVSITSILKKNKVPIICGGTGFYIDAVVCGAILPKVKPDHNLREKLAEQSANELFEILYKLDQKRAEGIDRKNKVRLIRAIEIIKTLGKVPKVLFEEKYNSLKIGFLLPSEILKEKIRIRLLSRIKKGMLIEIKNLHEHGLPWKRMHELGLEYRYGALYLQKKISEEEMIEKLNTEIWHYAKRQRTWFQRDKSILWIDPSKLTEQKKALRTIKAFLK